MLAIVAPGSAYGQAAAASDSSPFRAGQYGVEFGLASGFGSIGFLRFHDPQNALLFDLQGSFTRDDPRTPDPGIGEPDPFPGWRDGQTEDRTSLTTRLALRRYAALFEDVQRFFTIGVLGRRERTVAKEAGEERATTTWTGGLFGEIGAAWMVTPNLALGATWTAQLEYGRTTSPVDTRDPFVLNTTVNSGYGLSFGSLGIRANLFF